MGQVKEVAYDPTKPHLQEYVRALVILNLDQPVRDTKVINSLGGCTAMVEVEYERVGKKCFHCLRLTHEKQRCLLFQGQKQSRSKEKENIGQGNN